MESCAISVNKNIQFTVESEDDNGSGTKITTRKSGEDAFSETLFTVDVVFGRVEK